MHTFRQKVLIPFLGSVHFVIAYSILVLGGTQCMNGRRIDHRAVTQQ